MDATEMIPSLALFTLIAVMAVAVVGFILFKRKRSNRHPMEQRPDEAIATVRVGEDAPRSPTIRATDERGPLP